MVTRGSFLEFRVHVDEDADGVGDSELLGGEGPRWIDREGREGGVVADADWKSNGESSSVS